MGRKSEPNPNLVFDFSEIYNCYINGKCDSKYLLQYCISMVATAFMMELRKVQYSIKAK